MAAVMPTLSCNKPNKRFHDLDALRAFAMLLGIVLHAIYWQEVVGPSSTNGNGPNLYPIIIHVIHGFRMPLFILLSGFFTAMLWRRRGVVNLLWHRFRRVLLPLLLFTPIVSFIGGFGWMLNPHIGISNVVSYNDPVQLEAFFKTENINSTAFGGLTPLQLAAREGNTESVRWLIASGADLTYSTAYGDTALDMARKGGFAEVEELLVTAGAPALSTGDGVEPIKKPLININFQHLWFLWFLWLLVLGFAAVALILQRISVPGLPAWLILTPARYLWLVPLTVVFQAFMPKGWGPDSFGGVWVPAYLLGYYAVFFGFGALYYHYSDEAGDDTQRWWLELLIAILVIFPLGILLSSSQQIPKLVIDALNVSYAWLMTFGLIGMFRRFFAQDNQCIRYVSDSSYFLYIMHFPLLLWLSGLLAPFALPHWLKIIIMCVVATTVLLFIYEHLVRYGWLGRWLNGPRTRRASVCLPANPARASLDQPLFKNSE